MSGVRAACFPASSNLGSTFDPQLLYRIGQELAEETKSKAASVLLAPTINVVRSPLGGRNYETYGEDPFVLGKLGAACVNGNAIKWWSLGWLLTVIRSSVSSRWGNAKALCWK